MKNKMMLGYLKSLKFVYYNVKTVFVDFDKVKNSFKFIEIVYYFKYI